MRLAAVRRALLAIMALLLAPAVSAQDAPAALVIANGGYAGAQRVTGAAEDAALVAAALRRAGFAVTALDEASGDALRAGIAAFAKARPRGGSALVYYRGRAQSAPARVASEGVDNWLLGVGDAAPGNVALGDILAMLNDAGVERQAILLDAVAPGLAEPAARSLRRAVIALASGPNARSRLAVAFADKLATSRAGAAELLLGVADTVAGGGAAAGWVLNPNAQVASTPPAPAPTGERAELERFNAAIACGSEPCLRTAMGKASGRWKAELAARIDQIAAVDAFDPANPRAAARPAPANPRGTADPAVVARLSATRAGQYQLGLKFLRGDDGFPTDDAQAYRWFERAAAPGLKEYNYDDPLKADPYWEKAMFVLGWFHHTGRAPAAFSPEKARDYWEIVARFYDIPHVDPDAAFYMAGYTERCVAATNHCEQSRVTGLYAHAKSVGITRERSPADQDFPTRLP